MKTESLRKTTILGARLGICAIVLATLPVTNAFSEEGHNTPLAAHEHGHGELMVAQDGNELLVELRLPGADVVGFEHIPENHDQEHAVEMAMDSLRDAGQWLRMTEDAQCRIEDAHVSSPLAGGMDDHGHAAQADEHAGHADEHAGDVHAEFMAEVHVHCDNPDQLSGLDIGLFKIFPTLEEIEFQAVVTQGQVGTTLDAQHASVRF